jgi:hypothetical protein
MLEHTLKTTALILIACLFAPGCSQFTERGRLQAAQKRYAKACLRTKQKQQAKFRAAASKPFHMPLTPKSSDNPISMTVMDTSATN